ncbi:uncharacterized protein LOC115631095 [Scaptodrosophila lebanonensis]|uniref:Uncharacterized protein LOC115631095 n=1 Tax=Drosophila lebanonensis TaxID=7225 RepID=A0A6J2U8V0_DROLE|nr:uncharacterized protein LOC115631095 [Scaptodrosophila lebanonensis]XP_030383607.1 uncharacterized protein LOC115631095 [Scaptodrosophila lebanonensis]
MENKSSVSALQEYCAQNKIAAPVYEYIDGEEGGYVCKVTLLDIEAYGNGRSKRDAKHLSALNVLRKIKKLPGTKLGGDGDGNEYSGEIPGIDELVDEMGNHNRDMLKELRDFCVSHDMPLPTIEIVQQSGSPNAPQFVACCAVASIKRYGKSDKKKDARQRAATAMLCVISQDLNDLRTHTSQLIPVNKDPGNTIEDIESERRLKFKTYRELTDSGNTENTSTKLCDRHNYFKKFFPNLKTAAIEVMNSGDYTTNKDTVLAMLEALKLTPRITTFDSGTLEPLLLVELNCDYDCVFMGLESQIYGQILAYFNDMLI